METFKQNSMIDRKYRSWGILLIILAMAAILALGWLKQRFSLIHAFDTGIYLQILSNLISGRGWACSITSESNFLAHHFQPIIALIIPFFSVSPTPFMLFCVSACAVALTVFTVWKVFSSSVLLRYLISLCVLVVIHPTISSRMHHSFVPEIMALPALTLLAVCLAKGRTALGVNHLQYLAVVILAGLTKETLWPCLAFTCFLHGTKYKEDRIFGASLGLVCIAIFGFLFLYWMPRNTNMPSYYGLRYYLPEGAERPNNLLSWILMLCQNAFSVRSLHTVVMEIGLLFFFVPLMGPLFILLGALPGLAFILLSTHMAVHNAGNQYQILLIPYLLVATLCAAETRPFFQRIEVKRWLPLFLVLPSLTLHIIPIFGAEIRKMMRYTYAADIRDDIEKAKQTLNMDKNAELIVDANLQPLLYDFPNLKVLLPFVGNPTSLSLRDYESADYIVTMVDIRNFNCRSIPETDEGGLKYDIQAFYSYCDAVNENNRFSTSVFSDSGLVVYKNASK